jgi:dTDP-4-amino-4,6-dideoxygalactose transaminase
MNTYVTKTFLPPHGEYEAYLSRIWQNDQITNQGPLLHELENRLCSTLQVQDIQFVSNGTTALQLALRALDITEGEIITTPFSYVATTSAILWEHCSPVFVDIDPITFCIDPSKIERAITPRTRAIMPVHVFGTPCDVVAIETIAKKHNVKVIYDAAHAFGVNYLGSSVLSYGDISTCSFHATKLFHTIEGGGVIANNPQLSERIELLKRFGHNGDTHIMLGINAKANEFQAAMGLSVLDHIDAIIADRKRVCDTYDRLLDGSYQTLSGDAKWNRNYAYYPIVFQNEQQLLKIFEALKKIDVYPRRYFYPSLNLLPYLKTVDSCPISEDITLRIACLPLFVGLEESVITKIVDIINVG